MQGKQYWRDLKHDVDFNRAVKFQNGYSCPGSMYKAAPAEDGVELMIENILEIQNRSYSELSVKMDHLFLDFDARINLLRGDVGNLHARMEALEQYVGIRRFRRRPGVIRALQAEENKHIEDKKFETIGLVDRPSAKVDRLFKSVDRLYQTVDRLPPAVDRLINKKWESFPTIQPTPRPDEDGLPLMKQPPVRNANWKNMTLHSVTPWITIEDYNLERLSYECEDMEDHKLRRKIEPYAKQMLKEMPFIRACRLEGKLEEIIERIVKQEMSMEYGSHTIATMCDREIRYRVPVKEEDPGDFEISITIGGYTFENALCDLGASSNTISVWLAKKLRLQGIRETNMTFKLADNSSITPIGKIDNVPIMIGDRFVAIDFYLLDTSFTGERDEDEQILLGREFLRTAGALIDCSENSVTFKNLGRPYLTFKIPRKEDYVEDDEEDYAEDYEEFYDKSYGNFKRPQKERLAVLTRSVAKMRVSQNPEEIIIRNQKSRPTIERVDRLHHPEPKRRATSMPSLTPMHRGVQSTLRWFRPEHIEHKIPYYYGPTKVTREQVRIDTEGFIEECKEMWPLVEQCNLEEELRRYVPLLMKGMVKASELCNRMAKLCDDEINRQIPKKLEDVKKPTIGCMIGYTWFEKAVCDTGAGVNIMPLSVAHLLKFDKLLERRIELRLADGRFRYTEGMLENVPLRTRSQFFAVDFHVMEFEEDTDEALILGRPFLHTSHAVIDCKTGAVTLRAKETADEERLQMSGNRPSGFSHTLPRGTFQPMSRNSRYTSTRRHMYAASLSFARVKEEDSDNIIDLTQAENEETETNYRGKDDEAEEDPEEDPMEDEEAEESEHDSDPTYK